MVESYYCYCYMYFVAVSPCNETQIECNGLCIVQSQLCDDVDDCGDNSDEIDCGKIIHYNLL